MDLEFIKTLAEVWTVYWLFIFIIVLTIWRWIPYILKQFTQLQETFKNALDEIQRTHREDMNTISNVFTEQVKESNSNHLITHGKLEELKHLVSKKK